MKSHMTNNIKLFSFCLLIGAGLLSCSSPKEEPIGDPPIVEDPKVKDNINLYTHAWDQIMNKGKLELFNDSIFTPDVLFHASPENIVGIENAKAYYANYLTGFSNIKFTIKNVFGQDDKIVKHWTFSGTHTGKFFGIPATYKEVNLEGTTIVRMQNGKIKEEQDFFDNLEFMQQLGLIPR